MTVNKIRAAGFRNLAAAEISLFPGVNVFTGGNGQGKTNFLEAVYICASGRSWRAKTDKELIGFPEREAFLYAETERGAFADKISVSLKRDEKKTISVNGAQIKKLGELLGLFLAVIFTPYDLMLVKGGPAERRKFLDVELCQLSKIYYYELKQYYHILRQRNNLLKNIRKDAGLIRTIGVWDEIMAGHGVKIMEHRAAFTEKISAEAAKIHGVVSDKKEELEIIYRPNAGAKDFLTRLSKSVEKDLFSGATSVGVHKDDLLYLINGQDARVYGSQGQQRLACLSSKLAEIEIIKETKNEEPVLLLDDVLSEFDAARQSFLLGHIKGIQTLITATGAESASPAGAAAAGFKVEEGRINLL